MSGKVFGGRRNGFVLERAGDAMVVSRKRALLLAPIDAVWETMLAVDCYQWRRDLKKTEIRSKTQWVEYPKKGNPVTFTTTCIKPQKRWEFDMEQAAMRGHWIGVFRARGEKTEVDFTEMVQVKNPLLRPILKWYLKKQQAQFVADLQRALLRQKKQSRQKAEREGRT